MQSQFVAGQRWLSEAEPDLGLGVVEETDGRHVRVHFPAVGQRRTYAARQAPLVRVRFEADDTVLDNTGRELRVRQAETNDGLILYRCDAGNGGEVVLTETMLNDRMRLNRPQDKLLARRIDSDGWCTLRHEAWLRLASLRRSPVFGLCGPRIDLIPHQLYIAAEVSARPSVRVLLADEVGLGKTIEAGLILHRLLISERARRVLVIVPEALLHQWLVEMLRRFNLSFSVFDRHRLTASDSDNAFLDEQLVLCTLPFLNAEPGVARGALKGEWDLLIVDEAHHLAWSEEESSLEYQFIEALAAETPNVLLLTATPEQLGRAGHFGRLRLLDPQRFHSYADFLAEEQAYAPIAEIAAKLIDGHPIDDRERRVLTGLLGDEADLDRVQVIARLIDRHGTGRVLFRNTRQAIAGFPRRHLNTYELPVPQSYGTVLQEPYPERVFGEGWIREDPRVGWLRDLLTALAPQKVLVICAHAQTAMDLRDVLLERWAIHAAIFHEGMEIVARDRAAAFFADPDQGSQALICSEIGSEGRNFQFAHHLVLFDLPLAPDLLEQRIGRLDRIGQRASVELHVPYLPGGASEALLRWYRDGLASFEASCPAATAVYERLGRRLEEALAAPALLAPLVCDAAALTARLNAELEAGRDRLLELHSFDVARAHELVEEIRASGDSEAVRDYMAAFWEGFGVEHEQGVGRSTVIRAGSHMLHEAFPGLSGDAATVTFERIDALAHEDRLFLTWEHPMVRGCMEMLTSDELGSAAVTLCEHPDFRTGTALLEVFFVVECIAPAGLEVGRFLPPTCLRFLLDAQGRDLADDLPHDALKGLCLSQNRRLIDTVIKSQSERLKPLLAHAEQLAAEAGRLISTDAAVAAERELTAEQQRLIALSRVNANVREVEIEQVALRRELIVEHLNAAKVRLDAIRIVVMR